MVSDFVEISLQLQFNTPNEGFSLPGRLFPVSQKTEPKTEKDSTKSYKIDHNRKILNKCIRSNVSIGKTAYLIIIYFS